MQQQVREAQPVRVNGRSSNAGTHTGKCCSDLSTLVGSLSCVSSMHSLAVQISRSDTYA